MSILARRRRFGAHTCFLCGRPLRHRNRADEHVFPRWLQSRFDLWTRRLNLLNRTSIQYRQLTVPCCHDCNTKHLSGLEKRVASPLAAGPHAVRALRQQDLYLWTGKILFGLLYKQYLIARDRANSSIPIVPRQLLEQLDLHHLYLQAARVPMEFLGSPGSCFVFETQAHPDPNLQFDFKDSLSLTAAIRLGHVGIIVSFEDDGAIQNLMDPIITPYLSRKLHPIQFDELTAQVVYNKMRLVRSSPSVFVEPEGGQVVSVAPIHGFSAQSDFDEWEPRSYARVLALTLGLPISLVFRPPDATASWLVDDGGNFHEMDVSDGTWPWQSPA